MTIADLEWFIDKSKPIIYIEIFVEFYNQKNYKQVHKIQEIVELNNWRTSIA